MVEPLLNRPPSPLVCQVMVKSIGMRQSKVHFTTSLHLISKNLENQPKTCFTTPVCQACITSNLCKTFDIASNRFSKCFLESQILHISTLVDKL